MIVFAINALWQVPLLAAAAWLFLRLARLTAAAEHRVWVGVLVCGLVLPGVALPGLASRHPVAPAEHAVVSTPRMVSTPHRPLALLANIALPQPTVQPAQHDNWSIPPVRLSTRTQRNMCLLYAVVMALGALRIARSSLAARRLLRDSQQCFLSHAQEALWTEVTTAMKLRTSCVSLRVCPHLCSPAVLGVFRPAMLLPPGFHLCSEAEQRAALCHELAHIRRRDCLVHAVCQVLALPLVWHPVAHFVLRQIAQTREMACDAVAANAMHSGAAYARSLLRLAQTMMSADSNLPAAPALGLFRSNKLEERIMRLTEAALTDHNPTRLSPRDWAMRALGTASLASALLVAGMVHAAPVSAQSAPADQAPASASSAQQPLQTVPAPPVAGTATKPSTRRHVSAAHGPDTHVIVRDGDQVHRWKASDGEPFVLLDDHAGDLTAQQKLQAEIEYREELKLADRDPFNFDLKFSGPEFKMQFDQLNSDLAKQTYVDQKQLAEQLALINSSEWQAKTKKQIDEAMAQLKSPEFNKNLNEALLHAQILSSPEMEKRMAEMEQRMDEASKRLDEATKALSQAQRQLEQQKQK